MGDFCMPSLGADMDVGTVLEWRVEPGSVVHRGDIVAVVDTDKSDIEVEIFEDGVVEALLVDVGQEVAVGTPLARIGTSTAPSATSEPVGPTERPQPPPPRAVEARPLPRAEPGAEPADGRLQASPLARRRAAELGVDLTAVAGSGHGGAILVGDVETSVARGPAQPSAEPSPGQATDRQHAMRRAIGDLMARSAREIPQYHLSSTVDVGPLTAWLGELNADRPVATRVLPAAALLAASARAAATCPGFNGTWVDGFRPAPSVHLGVAVALRGGGLVAPAIHDADRLGITELMAALADLVMRARAGRLRASEMADGTLTVTSLGARGAEEVHGLIYAPQVALVGFGRIVERPWAVDGLLGVRPTVRVTLAADHRVTDGHAGSGLLATIGQLLQRPEDLR